MTKRSSKVCLDALMASRNFIKEIARRELQAGLALSTEDFRHATWADYNYRDPKGKHDPSGVNAFVKTEDVSHTIYLGGLWNVIREKGAVEIGALIVHELTHFDDIGYSTDGYSKVGRGSGTVNSPAEMGKMRREFPEHTLQHAYSIENYARDTGK